MNSGNLVLLVISVIVLSSTFMYYVLFVSDMPIGPAENYDQFAKCMTGKGVKIYGANWCNYTREQMELFGISFGYVDFTDCDVFKRECMDEGIDLYPTWVIAGEKYNGTRSMRELSDLSGCPLE